MKKILKKEVIIAFIIGIILASSIAVYAYSYAAKDIGYTKPGTTTEINVETALNDLYENTNSFVAFFNSNFNDLTTTERKINVIDYNSSYASVSDNVLTISKPGNYTAYITVGHSPLQSQYTNTGTLYINNTSVKSITHNYIGSQGTVKHNFSVNDNSTASVKYTVCGDTTLSNNTAEFGSVIILKNP